MRPYRLLLALLVPALVLTGTANATWTMVIANSKTGEIGVGEATCIVGPDLQLRLAVVIPGVGGAAVSANWDNNSMRRKTIWDGLLAGKDPDDILDDLQNLGSYNTYQFGIVDLQDRMATHTGSSAGAWAGGLKGRSGDFIYTIQGNVLAGQNVVLQAEQAIVNTSGDVADKLMAGMLAAAYTGGDGRCSCDPSDADACGAPPPGFDPDNGDKSAHVGYMVVSRVGERRGPCNSNVGCASGGEYYLNFNIAPGQNGPPDPVLQMEGFYQQWLQGLVGRPDHLLTQKAFTEGSLPGNGNTTTSLDLTLVDRFGLPVGHGGHNLRMGHQNKSAKLSTIGDIVDHGDGTYSIEVIAGEGQGTDIFRVFVDDGASEIMLYPFPTLELRATLTADTQSLSAATGGTVQLGLEGPEQASDPAPRDYLLLGSISGTEPGLDFFAAHLPLNFDQFFLTSFLYRNGTNFVNTHGTLAVDGVGAAAFVAPPAGLAPLVGFEISFAYLTIDRVDFGSNVVSILITP